MTFEHSRLSVDRSSCDRDLCVQHSELRTTSKSKTNTFVMCPTKAYKTWCPNVLVPKQLPVLLVTNASPTAMAYNYTRIE